jgi:DNA-binding MarR family transcriptional regulator
MAIPRLCEYIAIINSKNIAIFNSGLEVRLAEVSQSHRAGTDALNVLPGYLLRRAANAMMAQLAVRLAEIELKISDATLLLLVSDHRDMTSSDIGQALDIQRANMVPLLVRLEKADLISRQPIDRKSQAIVLTNTGNARLAQVRAITGAFEADLMARIPERHRAHFIPSLRALLEDD